MRTLDPVLRNAALDLLGGELPQKRALEVVVAVESLWFLLGYGEGEPIESAASRLSYLIAAVLEAEAVPAIRRRKVSIRLATAGGEVVASAHVEEDTL